MLIEKHRIFTRQRKVRMNFTKNTIYTTYNKWKINLHISQKKHLRSFMV